MKFSQLRHVNTMHDVEDQEKVEQITQSLLRDGWIGRPLVIQELDGALYAWTGVHRLAALERAYEIDDDFDCNIPLIVFENDEINWWSFDRYEDIPEVLRLAGEFAAAEAMERELDEGK